jgi:hypothetical protein
MRLIYYLTVLGVLKKNISRISQAGKQQEEDDDDFDDGDDDDDQDDEVRK